MSASSMKPITMEIIAVETDFGAPAARPSTSIFKAEWCDSGDMEAEEWQLSPRMDTPHILGMEETV